MTVNEAIHALSELRDRHRLGGANLLSGMESRPLGWILNAIVGSVEGHSVVILAGQETVGGRTPTPE